MRQWTSTTVVGMAALYAALVGGALGARPAAAVELEVATWHWTEPARGAVLREMVVAGAVKFLREQPRHSGDPQVRRLVEDDVELPVDRSEHAARIGDVKLHPLVVERPALADGGRVAALSQHLREQRHELARAGDAERPCVDALLAELADDREHRARRQLHRRRRPARRM